MINRKRQITLIIFLAFVLIIIVSEQIKGAYGDVKAPFLMERAVEAIIWADPEAGNHPIGITCGLSASRYISLFTLVFYLARTEDIIPFFEHRALFVRQAVQSTLKMRGEKAMPAIRRASKSGSARIKLELIRYTNPKSINYSGRIECKEEYIKLLNEIINNDKLKVFPEDTFYLPPMTYNNNMSGSLNDFPVDIIKFYLRIMEADFVPDKVIAIDGLGRLGPLAAPVVPVLIEILEGKDNDRMNAGASMTEYGHYQKLYSAAIETLGKIGPPASAAVPIIESKLDTDVYKHIITIREALYKIGKDKEEHLSFILDEFNIQSPGKKMKVLIWSIHSIGAEASAALPKLIEIAKTGDRSFRNQALMAIDSIEGSNETSKKIQMEGLKSEDPKLRAEFVQDFQGSLKDPEIKAILFEMCKDPDPDVKYQAVSRLFSYGRERESLVPYLIEIINAEPQGRYAQDAMDKIRYMEEYDFSVALPGMLNLLSGPQNYKIKSNIKLIIQIGGTYDDIVNKLIEFISSEDEKVAKSAIEQLGELGGKASAALLPLYKQYHTRGKYLDRTAKKAIKQIVGGININTDISPDILIAILDSLDHQHLRKVVNIITAGGTDFKKIVPRLGQISRHGDTQISNEAMKMLESHGDGSLSALPELAKKLVGNGDYIAGSTTLSILKSVTPETKGSVEDILPLLWSRNRKASYEAALAVFRMTGSYDLAANELIKVLEIGSTKQRKVALKTLGRIGGGAHKALPALQAEFRRLGPGYQLDVKRTISSIMKTIEPDENLNLDELLDSLEVGTDQDIKDAANALIKATGEYQAVIDRLEEIALSNDDQLRNRGLWALGGLETHQTEALLKLSDLHKKHFWDRTRGAGYQMKTILQKIEPGSDVDPVAVLKVMESPNQEVVHHGTEAYIALTGKYEPVVDRLIELLYHENQYVRANASFCLARLKGKAAKALPVLESLEKGDVEEYNTHRKYAIDEIKRGMRKL